ncbi:MAG: histidine kinase dimerization/phosphoacceptor domain-containing protein, partial [Chloroflexota bacterium]|nr:histidine kinase dimerization/phosphoacceptor domain-containing protein [Chloroflexota bacterium]
MIVVSEEKLREVFMVGNIKKQFENQLLFFVGYFAWGAVALLGIRFVEPGPVRAFCLGSLILYGVLFGFSSKIVSEVWQNIYYLVQTAIVAALIALNPDWGVFPILYFMLSAEVMMSFSQRKGLLWIGAFALLTAGIFVLAAGWQVGIITSLPYIAGYLFFGIFALAMAQARRERDKNQRLLQELQEVHRKLQDYSTRVEELAISKERNRLAREMHDTLGHRLTVAAVQLEGAQRLIGENPEKSA